MAVKFLLPGESVTLFQRSLSVRRGRQGMPHIEQLPRVEVTESFARDGTRRRSINVAIYERDEREAAWNRCRGIDTGFAPEDLPALEIALREPNAEFHRETLVRTPEDVETMRAALGVALRSEGTP